MFKKDEIDDFMKLCRVECFNIKKESKRILRGANRSEMDINNVVKKAIDQGRGREYTPSHGEPDQIKGLREEVKDGGL